MDEQRRRTRAFVGRHLLVAHIANPSEEDGCMICVGFDWGTELAELDPAERGQLFSELSEKLDDGS